MFICICNNITEEDLRRDPGLISKIGIVCGQCVSDGDVTVSTDYEGVGENRQGESR